MSKNLVALIEDFLVNARDKGNASDYYRLSERKVARECIAWLAAHPGASARDALTANDNVWFGTRFHSFLAEIVYKKGVHHEQE